MGGQNLGQFESPFSHFQPISQSHSQSCPLPSHHPYQQTLFLFSVIDPTSSLCTLNQQKNSIPKSSQTFSRVWQMITLSTFPEFLITLHAQKHLFSFSCTTFIFIFQPYGQFSPYHLTTILSNNPFSSLSHSGNYYPTITFLSFLLS